MLEPDYRAQLSKTANFFVKWSDRNQTQTAQQQVQEKFSFTGLALPPGVSISNNKDCSFQDFTDADLPQISMVNNNLSGSNFANGFLEGADLSRTILLFCQFSENCQIRDMNVAGAILLGATIDDQPLTRERLKDMGAINTDSAIFTLDELKTAISDLSRQPYFAEIAWPAINSFYNHICSVLIRTDINALSSTQIKSVEPGLPFANHTNCQLLKDISAVYVEVMPSVFADKNVTQAEKHASHRSPYPIVNS